ncbi:MAG: hypothetical protein LBC10_03070 [Deltaproteobacteria bacterium]|nr:hypothetical protein [Deltaproteobacteria bacterium]
MADCSEPPVYHAPPSGKADAAGWIRHPPRPPVQVLLQPEEKTVAIPKAKTARAVLHALGLRECSALVIRDGGLLTPDRAVAPGESLIVRKVTSSG